MYNRAELIIDKSVVNSNFKLFIEDKPKNLKFSVVVKNKGCGLGLNYLANLAEKYLASFISVANIEEAIQLEKTSLPILIFGERSKDELDYIASKNISIQVQSLDIAKQFAKISEKYNRIAKIHFKIDSGLGRYGIRWDEASSVLSSLMTIQNLKISGIMSHLAMSDELDKSYANIQFNRFNKIINQFKNKLSNCYIHLCNSGGYLDLPHMHYNLCRIGVLFTGNYPSSVCRRINIKGNQLKSPFKLKSKISFIKNLKKGDHVGYGMHYKANRNHKIGIIPIGYGDGYPRLRNSGEVLIRGQRLKILGGIAMDNLMVDLTSILNPKLNEQVILLGKQKDQEITAYELSKLTNSVVYNILTSFQPRLKVTYI